MQKIIKDSKEINVSKIEELENNNLLKDYMIFYFSQNKTYPVFLKKLNNNTYGFEAPIFGRKAVFQGNTIRAAIECAQVSREVFIIHVDQYSELFKMKK